MRLSTQHHVTNTGYVVGVDITQGEQGFVAIDRLFNHTAGGLGSVMEVTASFLA